MVVIPLLLVGLSGRAASAQVLIDGVLPALQACLDSGQDYGFDCTGVAYQYCLTSANPTTDLPTSAEECWYQESFAWDEVNVSTLRRISDLMPAEISKQALLSRASVAQDSIFEVATFLGSQRTHLENPVVARVHASNKQNHAIGALVTLEILITGCQVEVDKCTD